MGLDPGAAVQGFPERTGFPTLTMFTSAIKVHQDTGGDLIRVLERFATAVRDRLHFINRLRAATIASRMGAVLMLVIPPLIVVFHVYREPTCLQQLQSSFWGRFSLGGAVGLQILGAILVFRIFKNSTRF
jgi:tight adherence protein B